MARPLRRVIIGLSIRLNRLPHEIEQLDMATIRQLLSMLMDINKPSRSGEIPDGQSAAEIKASFNQALGKKA